MRVGGGRWADDAVAADLAGPGVQLEAVAAGRLQKERAKEKKGVRWTAMGLKTHSLTIL